jgi:O-antigen ligase
MNSYSWRIKIAAVASAVVSVWLGTKVAQEQYFFPVLIVGILGGLAFTRYHAIPIGTLLLGGALIGYIVGNRGFAQISLSGELPILPAEFVLFFSGGILLFRSALRQEMPVRRDLLNVTILVWIGLSTIRLYPDLNTYGVMAIRDYATVYYAAFFFLAQKAASDLHERRFLNRCLNFGFVALLALYPIYALFPDFFLTHFLIRGVPLIFFKGDLLGTFLAAGSVFSFARFDRTKSRIDLVLSLLMAGSTMTTNNRASMLGLIVPAIVLAIGRRPRFLALLTASGLAAIVVLFLVSFFRGQPWENSPVHEMYERAVSLTDPYGERNYSGEETSYKGDNNVFRTTWWNIVIGETVRTNPWIGMGWGADLAEPFVRIYYPEGGEDFTARSPHNVVVTVFARTGFVGLLPFLGLMYALAAGMWRAVRSNTEVTGMWCVACTILTSACFGVVLEGPMGAILFWVILGMANSGSQVVRDQSASL